MAAAVGRVDILVNSAGVNLRKPAVDYPIEKWDELIRLNLSAPFYCARALAPQMIARGWDGSSTSAQCWAMLVSPSAPPTLPPRAESSN
jgi:NAD(P)-dependent dehydrogenase (short-subunit alcohol dehydrogenase family)